MSSGLPLLIVSVLAAALLVALVSVWRRYAEFRADHDRQLKQARGESVRLSRSALLGNAVEQIVPIAPAFCDRFSPSDARFLGSPVDYVIFDGLHRGQVDRVVFLEVKSGARASLNRNEREVRRAIDERRVEFEVLALASPARGRALE
jgi:predicted Holliday junction resolvase-like endonuclease